MTAGAFWQFSLALYAQGAVPPACLSIQDEAGADVNIALFLLFLARQGVAVDRPALERIEALIGPWREQVVKPLRGVRRVLKTELAQVGPATSQALRTEVKRLELESERLEHLALESLAGAIGRPQANADRLAIARSNLNAYAALLGKPLPEAATATLVDSSSR